MKIKWTKWQISGFLVFAIILIPFLQLVALNAVNFRGNISYKYVLAFWIALATLNFLQNKESANNQNLRKYIVTILLIVAFFIWLLIGLSPVPHRWW